MTETSQAGSRDNTAHVLTPSADGIETKSNDVAMIDASHADLGYIMVSYTGDNAKVKLQITKDGETTYTYDLGDGYETFPLSNGDGSYTVAIFENIDGNQYSTCLSHTLDVTMSDPFGAFLYPNKYVWFTQQSTLVAKSEELSYSADTDLDVVSSIYNYVIDHMTYDRELGSDMPTGYIPDPEVAYKTGVGVCLDYASLMAAMLRAQGIPTHLEVGYAGTAYHAWISTYITDVGWVNGMISFDGENWEIMDPTYAANSSEESLKEFIGDNSNYVVKYIY